MSHDKAEEAFGRRRTTPWRLFLRPLTQLGHLVHDCIQNPLIQFDSRHDHGACRPLLKSFSMSAMTEARPVAGYPPPGSMDDSDASYGSDFEPLTTSQLVNTTQDYEDDHESESGGEYDNDFEDATR